MSEIPIRSAVPSDVQAIFNFLTPFMVARQVLPRSMNEIAVLIQHGFVAELASEIVGFAAVEVYSKKLAEVQCLAVEPEYRGQGLGKRLVSLCVNRARQLKVAELMAITATEKLFEECGFGESLPNQKRALFIQTNERHTHQYDFQDRANDDPA